MVDAIIQAHCLGAKTIRGARQNVVGEKGQCHQPGPLLQYQEHQVGPGISAKSVVWDCKSVGVSGTAIGQAHCFRAETIQQVHQGAGMCQSVPSVWPAALVLRPSSGPARVWVSAGQ